MIASSASAQYKITVDAPASFTSKEAFLYSLNGSKDLLSSKAVKKGNSWVFQVPERYIGMMKVYFPETNNRMNFISENKDVKITIETTGNKISQVIYHDDSNKMMEYVQDHQKKNEVIFPALVQIKDYYKSNTDFGIALNKEINRLNEKVSIDAAKYPFIYYYHINYNKFLVQNSATPNPSQEEISNFIYNSNDFLESSSLLRPLLVGYLNSGNRANVETSIDALLNRLDVTSGRGQTVLSEFIDVFDVYSMSELKDKYLNQAKNLKCTINERLASTLKSNKNVEIGNVFPDYVFKNVSKSNVKSLHDVKADKKIIFFWSSSCSHCDAELPKLLEKYNLMKAQGVEIIGLSLDADKTSYENKIAALPWINDTELQGWNSSYTETYNIHATPTYFVLDAQNKIIAKPDHVTDVLKFLNL